MANRQKDVTANIRLNGSVGSGFTEMERRLNEMFGVTDKINRALIEFGKESVDVYKNYETNMLDARGALSAQYRDTNQLDKVMASLEEHASKWASTTIFHTDDVSKAIAEASHAGYGLEQQLAVIPSAMLAAQSGGLTLSEGLDDLIKMMNATKTPFEEAGTVVDQWTYASNRSATNIGEMGEAFKALGASAMFADSTAELFTMMAVLADVGTVGSQAGTMIRNSMIRLIAPTKKASDAMEDLMVTDEELADVAVNMGALEEANRLLAETGFDAYDGKGKLKPFLKIYKDLYKAVSGMEEVDRNKVLSAIFPTRTISTAMALLQGAADDYGGLYEELVNQSEGYSQQVSDIMMSGLMGSTETLASKWEEFQRRVGETISGPLEDVQGWLGGFIDQLNALPQEALTGLVDGLAAMVGMTTVGAGALALLKALTALGPVGAGLLIASAGVGFLVGYLGELNEMNFEANFGQMSLDVTALSGAIDDNRKVFVNSRREISDWDTAVQEGLEKFTTLTESLSGGMLTAAIAGKELTDQEIGALNTYGVQIGDAVLAGIQQARARDLSAIDYLFGDIDNPEEARLLSETLTFSEQRFAGLTEKAQAIGQELRDQMTAALADRTLDTAEREAIMATVDRLTQIEAEIASGARKADIYARVHGAGRVSWDSAESFISESAGKYREDLAGLDRDFDEYWGNARATYDYKMAHAESDAEREEINAWWTAYERTINARQGEEKKRLDDMYGQMMGAVIENLMRDSDLSQGWAYLNGDESVDKNDANAQLGGIVGIRDNILKLLDPFEGAAWADAYAQMLYGAEEKAQQAAQQSTNEWLNQSAAEMAASANTAVEQAQAVINEAQSSGELTAKIEYENDEGSFRTAISEARRKAALNPIRVQVYSAGNINRISPAAMYAEGGRATEASVFGEDGAEWAIPEEHSARTADLLNAARAASGFTWSDLIGRYGGLNGDAGHAPVTVNYAPVINAADAAGVDAALIRDKERLMKALRGLLDDMSLTGRAAAYV